MRQYKTFFCGFIKDLRFMLPTIIITFLSFGFTINNAVIGLDDTAFDIYFKKKTLIAQGRFGPAILDKIFHIYNFNPFFLDLCAVIVLFISAVLFCSLFKVLTEDKLHPLVYPIFSCFFISYPLMSEIFGYMTASFSICFSFLFIAVAIILINLFFDNFKYWYFLLISLLLIIISISCYESFASVYICVVFAVMILKFLYSDKLHKDYKVVFLKGLVFALLLILALFLENSIANIIIKILDITPNTSANTAIFYDKVGLWLGLINFFKAVIDNYFIIGLWYLPITMFVVSVIVAFVIMIVYLIKYKKTSIIILFLGLFASTLVLSLIKGEAAPYRTCQAFAFFVAFIMMLVSQIAFSAKTFHWMKRLTAIVLCLLIFYQTKDLHKWFYLDYSLYIWEKNIASDISIRLNNEFDTTKPIVFAGNIDMPLDIYKQTIVPDSGRKVRLANYIAQTFKIDKKYENSRYIQSNINVFFNWGNVAFGPGQETHKFFRLNGFYFKTATDEMVKEAEKYLPQMGEWPAKNSIIETDEFIIVQF